jgi:galactose mutarotase-like enzyme
MMESSVHPISEKAAPEENVVIQVAGCSVTLLPAFGGKISSIEIEGAELLQAPLNPYSPRGPETGFEESDAGGWDECIPSVSACTVDYPGGEVHAPDHGDLWGVPWQVLESDADSVTMQTQGKSLPLELTRSSILAATDSGWTLHLLYTLANVGDVRVPWLWSAHPLFAVDAQDRIVLPDEVAMVQVEGSMNGKLRAGQRALWPVAEQTDGAPRDLSVTLGPEANTGDKLFAGPLLDGWCALERRRLGLRLTMRFETSTVPWLGLWLCYGGWPERPGTKQVCVAIEPTTASADSLSAAGESTQWLSPGASVTWPLELSIDRLPVRTISA